MHKGDRLNVKLIACKCDKVEQLDNTHASKRKAEPGATEGSRRQRGFTDDLDPTAQGIFETNERK